jgi:hypothetical protein
MWITNGVGKLKLVLLTIVTSTVCVGAFGQDCAEGQYPPEYEEEKCESLGLIGMTTQKYNNNWYCVYETMNEYFDEKINEWEYYTDACYIWDYTACQWVNNPNWETEGLHCDHEPIEREFRDPNDCKYRSTQAVMCLHDYFNYPEGYEGASCHSCPLYADFYNYYLSDYKDATLWCMNQYKDNTRLLNEANDIELKALQHERVYLRPSELLHRICWSEEEK